MYVLASAAVFVAQGITSLFIFISIIKRGAAKKSSQSTMAAVDAIFPATLATEKNNDENTHCSYYDDIIIVVVIHYYN